MRIRAKMAGVRVQRLCGRFACGWPQSDDVGIARTIGELKRMSSPHGRTRMIVFPLRRSVELKAATASSRVETLPMFVRSRPSRARRTISLSWARSGTTTKSTVRPSAGRASLAAHQQVRPVLRP